MRHGTKNCQQSFPEVSGNIPGNSWIKGANTCLQPVNYTFNACHFIIFSPEFYPVGKNFWNLTKLSEIFSGEFVSRGTFPRGTFRNFSKVNPCLQPWIYIFLRRKRIINSCGTSWSRDKKLSEKFPGHFRKHSGQLKDKSVQTLVYSR
jgi:hypothetical protein